MQQKGKQGKGSFELMAVAEIRNGVLILKDGSMRSILLAASVNFALKSEDEQQAIIFAYQDFINSLDFPIQITVTSRKMDIAPYLEEVKALRDKQPNELLRLQMSEYITFVGELVKESNIMAKSFYITVPFAVTQDVKKSFLERVTSGAKAATGKIKLSDEDFERNRAQLLQRVEQVAVGLRGIGLRVVPLQTQELLELCYTLYNPSTSRNQRLRSVGALKIAETEGKAL